MQTTSCRNVTRAFVSARWAVHRDDPRGLQQRPSLHLMLSQNAFHLQKLGLAICLFFAQRVARERLRDGANFCAGCSASGSLSLMATDVASAASAEERLEWTSIVANPSTVDRDKLASALNADGQSLASMIESIKREEQKHKEAEGAAVLPSPAASDAASVFRTASPPPAEATTTAPVPSTTSEGWFRPPTPESVFSETKTAEDVPAHEPQPRQAWGDDIAEPAPKPEQPTSARTQSTVAAEAPRPPPSASSASARSRPPTMDPEELRRRNEELEHRERAEIKRQIRMYEKFGFQCDDYDEHASIFEQREALEMIKSEFEMQSTIEWVKNGINLLAGLAELVWIFSLCPKWMKLKGLSAAMRQEMAKQELTLQQIYFQYKRHMEVSPVAKFGTGVVTTVVGVQVVNMVAESRVLKHPVVSAIGKMFGVDGQQGGGGEGGGGGSDDDGAGVPGGGLGAFGAFMQGMNRGGGGTGHTSEVPSAHTTTGTAAGAPPPMPPPQQGHGQGQQQRSAEDLARSFQEPHVIRTFTTTPGGGGDAPRPPLSALASLYPNADIKTSASAPPSAAPNVTVSDA